MSTIKLPPLARIDPDGDDAPLPPALAVRRHVLDGLGRPPDLYAVKVVRLWDNTYRVNVLVGAAADAVRCPHSYFVEATDDGAVLSATPRLVRVYA